MIAIKEKEEKRSTVHNFLEKIKSKSSQSESFIFHARPFLIWGSKSSKAERL